MEMLLDLSSTLSKVLKHNKKKVTGHELGMLTWLIIINLNFLLKNPLTGS
jgi:hypothetical protein